MLEKFLQMPMKELEKTDLLEDALWLLKPK